MLPAAPEERAACDEGKERDAGADQVRPVAFRLPGKRVAGNLIEGVVTFRHFQDTGALAVGCIFRRQIIVDFRARGAEVCRFTRILREIIEAPPGVAMRELAC